MGKRSQFPRHELDFYPTPEAAILPLLPHLKPGTVFDEPCCGDMSLVNHLEAHGHHCLKASDIEGGPWRGGGYWASEDALEIQHSDAMCFITNPPWRRDVLHPLIDHLTALKTTWLLIDADWMHTRQSARFLADGGVRRIVSIGRVKWIADSKNTGKDNCVWIQFPRRKDFMQPGPARFYGRST